MTEEVNRKRVLLGAVLAQVRPAGMERGVLTLVLSGNQFHRDRLLEPLNQDILGQAVRRWVSGAERFTIAMEGETETGPARASRRAGGDGGVPGRDRGRARPLAGRRRLVKGFGNIMKEAQKLQQQMEKIQAEVAQKKVDATAGGGMVTVEANGKQEIVSIKIDPEVVSRTTSRCSRTSCWPPATRRCASRAR